MKDKAPLYLVIVILLLVCLNLVYFLFFFKDQKSSGPKPVAVQHGGTSSANPPISVSTNALLITADVFFPGGATPAKANLTDEGIYIFNDMDIAVTVGAETVHNKAYVKKKEAAGKTLYVLGMTVSLKTPVEGLKSVDSITIKMPGYKDVEFKNLPINNKFVVCPEVVMNP